MEIGGIPSKFILEGLEGGDRIVKKLDVIDTNTEQCIIEYRVL